MSVPLLGTKLFVPRPRADLVPRDRLAALVDRGLSAKLLVVSAPAGFGKTTAVVERLAAAAAPPRSAAVAWLALDAGDDDPAGFWTYVVSALRTAVPAVGSDALALLGDPQPPPIEVVLASLLNDLAATETDTVLVLDDYHLVSSLAIHTQLAFLLDHLPPHLHLVLVSRADPALPLARLRASGEMVEVRAADLRFSVEETTAYFASRTGVSLTADEVSILDGRTEGWVAALQLAALSMADRDDPGTFIRAFAGDDRYLVDYLVEEVLQRQPEHVQDFLLRTSVLDRMTGALCAALVEGTDGRAMLESLDRANLFLVPLDDRRRWYRYHHLFADVLRARLHDEHPGLAAVLHLRASWWFEEDGDRAEAIRHARAAGEMERVAELVELEMPRTRRDRREPQLRRWFESLPDEVLRVRPLLANGLAGTLLSTGTVDGVEAWIDAAEAWLDPDSASGVRDGAVVADVDRLAHLPGGIEVHRAGLALTAGDLAATTRHARRAEALATDDDHLTLGAATALVGLASWSVGDLAEAEAAYSACLPHFRSADHVADVLGCSLGLSDIQVARGRLREALRTLRSALDLATTRDDAVRGTTDMHIAIAALQVELGHTEAARESLGIARALGDQAGLPQSPYRWRCAMARVLEADGDVDGALTLLAEAAALYNGDLLPNVRPVPARLARLALRHDRRDVVADWVATSDLSLTSEVSYLREYELTTLARAALATSGPHNREVEALDLLRRLRMAAEDAGRVGSLIDICTTEALVHADLGDRSSALSSLSRALTLAEPEGHVRHFLDEGSPAGRLLADLPRDSPVAAYAHDLSNRLAAGAQAPPGQSQRPPGGPLVEPLSAREREILELLSTELTGPEIARRLVVSLNTVRTHTKNVYLKLGVNSRMAALRRARELDLL